MEKDANVGLIVEQFLPQLIKNKGVSAFQLKVLNALKNCRTSELGGSAKACKKCGTVHYMFHSCRNRHCPKCQGLDQELWTYNRKKDLLPVKYFHVVFTVPHELLELFRFNKKIMYDLLFEKSWETLHTFASDPKWLGGKLGATAILHTWDQKLKLHPHIHFIIPAGALNKQNEWVKAKQNGDFLFDVKMLSAKFSAIFAEKLRALKKEGKLKKRVPYDLIKKPWVVYAKKAFGSPEKVLEYLSRYTHKVGISDARILKVTKTHVTFKWIDRENNYESKTETITGIQFLERFIQHFLPPYFRKIRHLGFLANRSKKTNLLAIRDFLGEKLAKHEEISRSEILKLAWGEKSHLACKECGGELVTIKTYPGKRAPPIDNRIGLRA